MGSLITTRVGVGTAVPVGGTIAVPYPPGTTSLTLNGSLGGQVVVNDNEVYKQASAQVAFSFNAASITVTNNSPLDWPVGTILKIGIGRTNPHGSNNVILGSTPGTAAPATGGTGSFTISAGAWSLSFFPAQGSATSSNTAGVIKLKGDGTNNAFADQQITGLTVGRRYALSYSTSGWAFGSLAIGVSQGDGSILNYVTLGAGAQRMEFTATAPTIWIRLGNSFSTEVTVSSLTGTP